MSCKYCSASLPDEAYFCWNCGKPQRDLELIEAILWETCEIVIALVKKVEPISEYTDSAKGTVMFQVEATGPNGFYYPYASEPFIAEHMYEPGCGPLEQEILHQLITKLTKDGWEHVGYGLEWYNKMFRRPVKVLYESREHSPRIGLAEDSYMVITMTKNTDT
jgi:hypothetical protein